MISCKCQVTLDRLYNPSKSLYASYCYQTKPVPQGHLQLQGNADVPWGIPGKQPDGDCLLPNFGLGGYAMVHKPKKHAEHLITVIQGTSISYLEKS